MQMCDMCSSPTTWEEGTGYTAAEFRKMVSQGLGPHESTISLSEAMGIPRDRAVYQWKNGLVAQSATGWLLCPSCAERAGRYLPKRAGAGPAGHVLTESVPVEKLFPSYGGASATRASLGHSGMARSRALLLLLAAVSLAMLFLPLGSPARAIGIRVVFGAAVAVLAARYASRLNRSGVGWGLFSFFLPTPTLFVLPFLKER